jgi:hypothetical protein
VDLFADWQRRADFPTAVDEVIAAYRAESFDVQVDLRLVTFARLHVTDPDEPDRQHRVELVARRTLRPVQMEIGPVLHPRRRHGRQDGRVVQPQRRRDQRRTLRPVHSAWQQGHG